MLEPITRLHFVYDSRCLPSSYCHTFYDSCGRNFTMTFVYHVFRKPYTPDIFNDLSPYYNKYIVDYMINDQVGNNSIIKCIKSNCWRWTESEKPPAYFSGFMFNIWPVLNVTPSSPGFEHHTHYPVAVPCSQLVLYLWSELWPCHIFQSVSLSAKYERKPDSTTQNSSLDNLVPRVSLLCLPCRWGERPEVNLIKHLQV